MYGPEERPPIATAPLSVILPAYNQESRLAEVVRAWVLELNIQRREYELLLVDDGSTDATAALAKELTDGHAHLRLLRHEKRRGFGAALRTGLAAARHPLVAYVPCNSRYQPTDLKSLFKWIDKVDVVIGYRTAQSRPVRKSWRERSAARLTRLFFGLRLRDPNCRFMLARREIFARIPIQSDGSFAHIEILAKANFLGCWMAEAPVTYRAGAAPDVWVGSCRQSWREGFRVFAHPDFGPAVLPEKA